MVRRFGDAPSHQGRPAAATAEEPASLSAATRIIGENAPAADEAGHLAATAADDVRELFNLLLGRNPDEEAFNAFTEALATEALSVLDVVRELARSEEFARRLAPQSTAARQEMPPMGDTRAQVDQMFRSILRRAPDAEALEAYATALDGGAGALELVGDLIGSQEFGDAAIRHPVVARAVARAAISSLMQRPATEAEVESYGGALSSNYPLAEFLHELRGSAEYERLAPSSLGDLARPTPYEIGQLAEGLIVAKLEAQGCIIPLPPLTEEGRKPIDGPQMRSLLLTLAMLAPSI